MRARAALVVLALALVASLVGIGAPSAATATAPTAPTPKVIGNRLVDTRTDTTWVPHGANWPSFEYACSQGWGYSQDDDTNAAAAAMVTWGINIVRVPLNSNCWLGLDSNDYGTATGYRAAVASWVNILNAHGIVVILDLHWSAPTGQHALGQWPMADSNSTTFWTSVATAYANDPSIIFDAFNEPYSIWNDATNSYSFQLTWDCWENGGCKAPLVTTDQAPVSCYNASTGACTYTVVGMAQLVAAIRAGGATQPIMLGGLNYSNDLSGWLAHKPNDSQLIASWHNYPGQDSCGYTAACWNAATSSLIGSVPIVTGEFGETDGASTQLVSYMNWADAHGIGYLPWAWWNADDVSGDAALYALFQGGSAFTPHAPAGTAYKAHLATLVPPPTHVFRTLPAPATATRTGSASAPATAVVPTNEPAEVRHISQTQLQQLALNAQLQPRIQTP
jgi:endoglucanase